MARISSMLSQSAAVLLSLLILSTNPGSAEATTLHKGPYLIYPGVNTEMKVLWQLDASETCTIEWGEDTTYSLGNTLTNEYGPDHQHTYTIDGLSPSTKYYYRVVASADIATGSFRTAPAADATAVQFIAYGDTRSYPAVHDQVAEAIVGTYGADDGFQSLIISVGDLVNNGNSESDWQNQFFDPFYSNIQTMLGDLPYQSCMGNHEGTGVLFTKYFPYPFESNRYWSFDYGPAHFVVVDQYVDYSPGSAQLSWIENDLASTTKRWRFIYLHEPGWSAGGHSNNTDVQNYIQPLCEQYGVKFVFGGHNHYYARAVHHGVQHITTGGGGAPLYAPNPDWLGVQFAAEAYHYCKVEIDGDWLTMTVVEPDGNVLESITKSTPVAVDVPVVGPDVPSQMIALYPVSPNPFGPATTIRFDLPRTEQACLEIVNVAGQRVRVLVDRELDPGRYAPIWDGRDGTGRAVAPGVYFVRLESSTFSATQKVVHTR